jgi:hypothetical protein
MPQYLSDQDYRDYGGELVDFSKRAAFEAVAPHLQNLEQENARLQHWLGVESRHRMDREVEAAVPNYREIDADPRWHNWLLSTDPLSGRQRQLLLNEAIRAGATARVVSFFRQSASQASYYGAPSSGKPVYTRAQIAQIYAAHRKGAYAGREAEWARIDADIIRAAAEGRVLGPDYITK